MNKQTLFTTIFLVIAIALSTSFVQENKSVSDNKEIAKFSVSCDETSEALMFTEAQFSGNCNGTTYTFNVTDTQATITSDDGETFFIYRNTVSQVHSQITTFSVFILGS